MDSQKLSVQPLTKGAFAPYGTVIETDGAQQISINQGTTTRFDALAQIDVAYEGGIPIISLFRGTRRSSPIEISMLERHPLGSQAFMPLANHDWLVVVAAGNADDSAPDFDRLVCFRATGSQGVSYDRGTWHHPLLILEESQDFLVMDRSGNGHNLDEVWAEDMTAQIDL
ncbi:ureidoglycolate lyase [Candidatus Puniceispirillum sp.]|uniref:ureidoglycolate lyase n=1 Tax=Candidatus Puniceispirillum sp. TaxID=2026719 RepID=UPI003F695950